MMESVVPRFAKGSGLHSYRVITEPWIDNDGNLFEIGSAIHSSAVFGRSNCIGPYAVIGPGTRMRNANKVEPFAMIGAKPQSRSSDVGYGLEIGDQNVFHCHVTVSSGSKGPTRIGNNVILMVGSHVGHDSVVGDLVTLGNNATLAGHVTIDHGAIVGAFSTVIQHAYIGSLAHILPQLSCRCSLVPAETFCGDKLRVNTIGIRRAGGTAADVRAIRYKLVHRNQPLPRYFVLSDWLVRALERWDENLR